MELSDRERGARTEMKKLRRKIVRASAPMSFVTPSPLRSRDVFQFEGDDVALGDVWMEESPSR